VIRRLADERCVPCREGERSLSGEELADLCEALTRWKLESRDGVSRIVKLFCFKSAEDGEKFAGRLARLAEAEDHHPEVIAKAAQVTVAWWTRRLRGLSRNDFILAAKTDRLADSMP
jgi:4a-hydroxytetrahydrobiopterin dehydratase